MSSSPVEPLRVVPAPRETARARAAYASYEALGPARSLEKLVQTCPKPAPLTTLKLWSRQHRWVRRAADHDERVRAEQQAQAAERNRKLRDAQLVYALESQRIAMDALRDKHRTGKVGAHAAVQLLALSFETQRKLIGDVDQRVEVAAPGGKVPRMVTIVMDGAGNTTWDAADEQV